MKTVDRNQALPIFYQLQNIFFDNIRAGVWKPGEQIPPESELCAMYDVSLITVRKALQQLEVEGLVRRMQGRGTFVAEKKVNDLILQSMTGTFAFSPPAQTAYSTRVIEKGIELPDAIVMEKLGLRSNQKVIKLVRLRIVDGLPFYWTKAYLPERLCPGLLEEDFEKKSLYEILKSRYGLVVFSAIRAIETRIASSLGKNYLAVSPGTPINVISSVSYLKDGSALEYSKNYFRSDRVRFEVRINQKNLKR